jgi:hypothetical protein
MERQDYVGITTMKQQQQLDITRLFVHLWRALSSLYMQTMLILHTVVAPNPANVRSPDTAGGEVALVLETNLCVCIQDLVAAPGQHAAHNLAL